MVRDYDENKIGPVATENVNFFIYGNLALMVLKGVDIQDALREVNLFKNRHMIKTDND